MSLYNREIMKHVTQSELQMFICLDIHFQSVGEVYRDAKTRKYTCDALLTSEAATQMQVPSLGLACEDLYRECYEAEPSQSQWEVLLKQWDKFTVAKRNRLTRNTTLLHLNVLLIESFQWHWRLLDPLWHYRPSDMCYVLKTRGTYAGDGEAVLVVTKEYMEDVLFTNDHTYAGWRRIQELIVAESYDVLNAKALECELQYHNEQSGYY